MTVVEDLKEKVEQTIANGAFTAASVVAWREYMSHCFETRQVLGLKETTLNYEKAQPTTPLKSCFRDYKKLCVNKKNMGGKTFVMYGPWGSGKSQTILTFVRGSCPLNPERGIYVNPGGTTRSGNEYMQALSKALSFYGSPRDLAQELVHVATNTSLRQKAASVVGCCDGIQHTDESTLISIIPPVNDTEKFDKFPVIAIDNVKFQFKKGDSLSAQEHGDFFNFINHLFEVAHGSNVVVFLTTTNIFLAEELVILNGSTKIVPASASIAVDSTESNWKQESKLQTGELVTFLWRKGLGWTKETMKKFLKRDFPGVPDDVIDVAVDSNWASGTIRSAREMVDESYPSLFSADTAKSDV